MDDGVSVMLFISWVDAVFQVIWTVSDLGNEFLNPSQKQSYIFALKCCIQIEPISIPRIPLEKWTKVNGI